MPFLKNIINSLEKVTDRYISEKIPVSLQSISKRAAVFLLEQIEKNKVINLVAERLDKWSIVPPEEEEDEEPGNDSGGGGDIVPPDEEEDEEPGNDSGGGGDIVPPDKEEEEETPRELLPELSAANELEVPNSETTIREYRDGYIVRVEFKEDKPDTVENLQNILDNISEYLFYKYGKRKVNKLDAQVILNAQGRYLSSSHLLPMWDAIAEARSFGLDNCLSINGRSGGGDGYDSLAIETLDFIELQVF